MVHAWADAIYSGDVDEALSYFTDDGQYLLYYTANGKENMRWVFNWLAGLETKWEFLDCQPDGDSIACSMTVLDGCMAASGPEGLPVKATFTFEDGKIKSVTGSGTGPEWDAYWAWGSLAQAWQSVFRPEESAKAVEGTLEGGAVRIGICRDYAAAMKTQLAATEAAVQAWVAALNSGDVDAALALFADDLKFDVFEYHARNKDKATRDIRLAGRPRNKIPDQGVPAERGSGCLYHARVGCLHRGL